MAIFTGFLVYEGMDRIPGQEEAFLFNRRNFASLVNNICYKGRKKVTGDDLTLVEEKILDDDALRLVFPRYTRCVTMHSSRGDIKLIQLGRP